MSSHFESSGDIEVTASTTSAGARPGNRVFGAISPGDRLYLVFTPIDATSPPYGLKIVSPSGATIMDTILRDLPTGLPQSPQPVEFVVAAKGTYRIEIREMKGRQRGEATLKVS
jgi:hypothetical protein